MATNNTEPKVDKDENTGIVENMKDLNLDSDIPVAARRANVTVKEGADVTEKHSVAQDTISYDALRMVGHGSFGAVFLAKVSGTNEMVAIKKVLQDRRFKNRELQVMRQLALQPHPYVVHLRHYFITKGSRADDVYLNLVLEYIPETMYSVAKNYIRAREPFPILLAQTYTYQMLRSLAHIHGAGICHRDIKPQNLLVDPERCVLKLCDFGSAKALVKGEPNVAYICSRYYRAPELIFGSTDYTTAIDVWSAGCVLAELLLGAPMFPGSSGVDQLVEVIKMLGTPSKDELLGMNPNYQEFKFPQLRATPLSSVFPPTTPPAAIDLMNKFFVYIPDQRPTCIQACGHEFFNPLRDPATVIPTAVNKSETPGRGVPLEFFQFTKEEISLSPEMAEKLVPAYCKEEIAANPLPFPSTAPQATGDLPSVAESS